MLTERHLKQLCMGAFNGSCWRIGRLRSVELGCRSNCFWDVSHASTHSKAYLQGVALADRYFIASPKRRRRFAKTLIFMSFLISSQIDLAVGIAARNFSC